MTSLLRRVMGADEIGPADDVPSPPSRRSVTAIVPLGAVDDSARSALSIAWSMTSASRLLAVHVCGSRGSTRAFTRQWEKWEPGVPLVLLQRIPSDGDLVAASVAGYLRRRHGDHQTLVVVTGRADALESALLPLERVVVCRQGADAGELPHSRVKKASRSG